MTIQEIRDHMKANKITQIMLAERSGLPLQTLRGIFSGKVQNPRLDTMQAIERALGLSDAEPPNDKPSLSDKQERLLRAYNSLIPPMQDYVLEMIEKLVNQPQNSTRRA